MTGMTRALLVVTLLGLLLPCLGEAQDAADAASGQWFAAIQQGTAARVAELIAKGADVDAKAPKGFTALHMAVGMKKPEIVQVLLDARADTNARDRLNMTPLHIAAQENSAECAKLLIDAGATIDVPGFDSPSDGPSETTPLNLAAQTGAYEVAELLIAAGADVNALTTVKGGEFRRSPLFWAEKAGKSNVAELLIRSGAQKYPPGATQN